NIQVADSEFRKVFRTAGMTSIINLELDGNNHPVVVKEAQKHPVKDQFLHVDFQELDMDEKIRVTIPINLLNRDNIEIQPSVFFNNLWCCKVHIRFINISARRYT